MSKQYHFVVLVNEDGTAEIEPTISLNFDNGDVWDTEQQQWYDHSEDEVAEGYDLAEAQLSALLKQTERK